ncbi:hypothetical protein DPMN_071770 [Dreissena polymorpha]|uniref:Uncharacterized protein n=1 Tax=Dreissena polymorpha TaxID=45954 RepID=A0A9D3Z7C8_DREPO|nr:hypothetical protein DPMN_071770 [Dreissena polymorpha]
MMASSIVFHDKTVICHMHVPLAKPKKTAKQLHHVLAKALSGKEALKLLKEREQKKQDEAMAKQKRKDRA